MTPTLLREARAVLAEVDELALAAPPPLRMSAKGPDGRARGVGAVLGEARPGVRQ